MINKAASIVKFNVPSSTNVEKNIVNLVRANDTNVVAPEKKIEMVHIIQPLNTGNKIIQKQIPDVKIPDKTNNMASRTFKDLKDLPVGVDPKVFYNPDDYLIFINYLRANYAPVPNPAPVYSPPNPGDTNIPNPGPVYSSPNPAPVQTNIQTSSSTPSPILPSSTPSSVLDLMNDPNMKYYLIGGVILLLLLLRK